MDATSASIVLNKNLMYLDKDCMDYPRDIVLTN